jgi:hypothetical protein
MKFLGPVTASPPAKRASIGVAKVTGSTRIVFQAV